MADLSGAAGRSAVEASAEDQTGAEPSGNLDVDDVRDAARRAEPRLPEPTEVRIVVHADGQSEASLELRRRPPICPARQDARRADDVALQRSWNPEHDGSDGGPWS